MTTKRIDGIISEAMRELNKRRKNRRGGGPKIIIACCRFCRAELGGAEVRDRSHRC